MKRHLKLYALVLLIPLVAGCPASFPTFSSSSSDASSSNKTAEAATGDTFITSDDYKGDDEVVGVFLMDKDYARMQKDFNYHGAKFDWGWVPGNMDGSDVQNLGFDIKNYATVSIPPVKNDSDAIAPDVSDAVHKRFQAAMKRLGLKVVPADAGADLELGVDIVDYNADHIYAFVTVIEPFIEMELRLKDLRTGKDLLLIRNQEHGATPVKAAGDYASSTLHLLRS